MNKEALKISCEFSGDKDIRKILYDSLCLFLQRELAKNYNYDV